MFLVCQSGLPVPVLKSIIEHYPIADDGILDEANDLWSELMQLKEEEKEIVKEDGLEVEISDE